MFQVEESVLNIGKFNSMVSLAAFFPFKSAQAALENMNAISEGKWRCCCIKCSKKKIVGFFFGPQLS